MNFGRNSPAGRPRSCPSILEKYLNSTDWRASFVGESLVAVGVLMKIFGNCVLSLLLCLLPLSFTPSGGFGAPEGSSSSFAAHSCCRPAPKACCHSECCVKAPERTNAPALPGQSPSATHPSPISPVALLHALWRMPAPPARVAATGSPEVIAGTSPGLPLFLRHASLLI